MKDEMARIKKELRGKQQPPVPVPVVVEPPPSERVVERPPPRVQRLQERKTGRTIVVSKGVVPGYKRPARPEKPHAPPRPTAAAPPAAARKQKEVAAARTEPPTAVDTDSFIPIAPKQLGSHDDFKAPDQWVASGASLDPSGVGRRLPVRIGLDFGTAFTKVAVMAGQRVYFVDWGGVSKGPRHFLGGEVSEAAGAESLLGHSPAADSYARDLKLPLLRSNKAHRKELEPAVTFLALVLRYVRAWAYRHPELGAVLRDRRPAWLLNVGCPTKSWEDALARDTYSHMGTCAWLLSQESKVTRQGAWELLRHQNRTPGDVGLDELHIVPEFLAQIGGYVKSPQRRDGLHLLVDVGAGTLDVATFNVYQPPRGEERRFPIFSCDVYNCGTHYLMANRADTGQVDRSAWSDTQSLMDIGQLSEKWGVSRESLSAADERFQRKVRQSISEILSVTRKTRYIRAPEWREGLPVFLAGGGSEYALYGDAVAEACALQHCTPKKIPPQYGDVESRRGTPLHRMSVAYGLTLDPAELGRILPRSEVEDDTPLGRAVERIHHEDLYSER